MNEMFSFFQYATDGGFCRFVGCLMLFTLPCTAVAALGQIRFVTVKNEIVRVEKRGE